MSAVERDLWTMRRLASMPFLDRLELAAVSANGRPLDLRGSGGTWRRRGLAASIPHATDLLRSTRRFHLTAAGLSRLAESEENMALEELIRKPIPSSATSGDAFSWSGSTPRASSTGWRLPSPSRRDP